MNAQQKDECTRTRILEFPPDDAVPLIQLERKITMALDPLGIVCGRVSTI